MQGKILVIDAISTNRIVFKVKLAGAGYEVLQAGSIAQAREYLAQSQPDLILTSLSLPDGTAADLCNILRTQSATATIPILALGTGTDPETRMMTLAAGAFDVMERPVDETLLLGRVRSMIRAYNTLEEWRMREETPCSPGLADTTTEFVRPGRVALVGEDAAQVSGWARHLTLHLGGTFSRTLLKDALGGMNACSAPPDVVMLSLPTDLLAAEESLRLISALRASAKTRQIGLLVIQQSPDPRRATQALDLGADDLMTQGFEPYEVALRLQVLLRRKQQVERMQQSVRSGLRDAVHDPLTGLYNRRYAMPHLENIISRAATANRPYAAIIADMDHFKRINDIYGHAAGDAVLVETAHRLLSAVRNIDMVARIGGEEFLVVMPGTDVSTARTIAKRLCATIGEAPFDIPGAAGAVSITVSIGLAMGMAATSAQGAERPRTKAESAEKLLRRADRALYAAKLNGRNRVDLDEAASRPAA